MRVALKVAYDGTRFSGSQAQPDARTVHGELARALRELERRPEEPRLAWAGRTDAGVSAAGNVIALETSLSPASLLPGLTFLMEDAWAWAWAQVDEAFEPRHARRRRYHYHLQSDLDAKAVEEAMRLFVGTRDFTAFARLEPGVNPVRTVEDARVARDGPHLVIDVTGRNFLWNQVRRMVEAARRVAAGEVAERDVRAALDVGRPADFGIAPPEPLLLVDVEYDGLRFERAAHARLLERLDRRVGDAEARLAVLRDLREAAGG